MSRAYSRLSRSDFKALTGARKIREDTPLLSVSYSPQKNTLKAACFVTKKEARRAVDRNLLKRRCREAFDEEVRKTKLEGTFTIRLKRAALQAGFSELKADLSALISNIEKRSPAIPVSGT